MVVHAARQLDEIIRHVGETIGRRNYLFGERNSQWSIPYTMSLILEEIHEQKDNDNNHDNAHLGGRFGFLECNDQYTCFRTSEATSKCAQPGFWWLFHQDGRQPIMERHPMDGIICKNPRCFNKIAWSLDMKMKHTLFFSFVFSLVGGTVVAIINSNLICRWLVNSTKKPDSYPKSAIREEVAVEYQVHIEGLGWVMDWIKNGEVAGTNGQGKRVEAIRVRLTNPIPPEMGVSYKIWFFGNRRDTPIYGDEVEWKSLSQKE